MDRVVFGAGQSDAPLFEQRFHYPTLASKASIPHFAHFAISKSPRKKRRLFSVSVLVLPRGIFLVRRMRTRTRSVESRFGGFLSRYAQTSRSISFPTESAQNKTRPFQDGFLILCWYSQGESNPCYHRERVVS